MRPEKVFYTLGGQPSTEVAIYHTWLGDCTSVLGGWDEETGAAVFQAMILPVDQLGLVRDVFDDHRDCGRLVAGAAAAGWPLLVGARPTVQES